ncbi:hypothetical protein PENTCL1PPCAC_7023 [Pristionchus entomophagus]|uniref:GTP cyclohydrolase 1 feedback regulatory protein n=1 Tax=Pristionchus entomophagus TaxID=358040 RepID=A0AAV5SRV6_9BILA|nr:hypothetical protein PENTCL1PPCAC_7023 [Pristionchus entomophagus]
MPHMIISGGVNTETKVGGKCADPMLMDELGAKKSKMTQLYTTPLFPSQVLDRLELKGWKIVAMGAYPNGELAWTLHRDETPTPTAPPMSGPPEYSEKPGPPMY